MNTTGNYLLRLNRRYLVSRILALLFGDKPGRTLSKAGSLLYQAAAGTGSQCADAAESRPSVHRINLSLEPENGNCDDQLLIEVHTW
ncbi:MAG: hypothetical protein KJN90_09710 [Gammaproteobacteria bacterium]|nr:hypothetical protein [Gammaproteobacteria bacterium]